MFTAIIFCELFFTNYKLRSKNFYLLWQTLCLQLQNYTPQKNLYGQFIFFNDTSLHNFLTWINFGVAMLFLSTHANFQTMRYNHDNIKFKISIATQIYNLQNLQFIKFTRTQKFIRCKIIMLSKFRFNIFLKYLSYDSVL